MHSDTGPATPVTRRPGRIGAVMLMQGDDMLLAFEVWPSSLFKGLAFTAKGRFCPQAFYTLQEEYLLSGLHARGPNERCCCANAAT